MIYVLINKNQPIFKVIRTYQFWMLYKFLFFKLNCFFLQHQMWLKFLYAFKGDRFSPFDARPYLQLQEWHRCTCSFADPYLTLQCIWAWRIGSRVWPEDQPFHQQQTHPCASLCFHLDRLHRHIKFRESYALFSLQCWFSDQLHFFESCLVAVWHFASCWVFIWWWVKFRQERTTRRCSKGRVERGRSRNCRLHKQYNSFFGL